MLSAVMMGLFGCNGATSTKSEAEIIAETIESGSQKTTFLLTDAPSDDFKSVTVDIVSPMVVTVDDKEFQVPLPDLLPIRVDLLELDGVSDLLTDFDLPAGKIKNIALTIANPEIVLLDDTVIGSDQIDLPDPVLDISPTDVAVPTDGGATILIDIDVAASVKIDVAGTGRSLIRPVGAVKRVDTIRPDGDEIRTVKGEIVEIPGIKGVEKSFLLKHRGRKHFVQVNAESAVIENFEGEVRFGALEKGQIVEISGMMFKHHVVKAKHVLILPREHRAIRGVITHLTDESFDLVFLNQDDREDDRKDREKVKVFFSERTEILMGDMKLSAGDLANGQFVGAHGIFAENRDIMKADVIRIRPTRFRGFIAKESACDAGIIYVVGPPKGFERILDSEAALSVLPIEDLFPGVYWMVNIRDAKLYGIDGAEIKCGDLNITDAVSVAGLLTRYDTGFGFTTVKAFEVKKIALHHIGGTVVSVGPEGKTLVLQISTGKHGFDRLDKVCNRVDQAADRMGLVNADGTKVDIDCDHFNLKVVLSKELHNPQGIVFDQGLVGSAIHMAGFFRSHKPDATTVDAADHRRHIYFFAVAVKTGDVPAPEPCRLPADSATIRACPEPIPAPIPGPTPVLTPSATEGTR